ncbi:NAD-dependent epimerase/dehydratase family protein [Paenibacillus pini]|uniref:UDP-glucose 4-epimerase n=1 Tax=Paenibacillus pini JCM 16418 TaxID=1236976 RepID=W7YVR2_9BACL|nr:NAD-dependent epimerase/dehydratase family protein [Paenibacillus pini]GAF08696.1 UDP-glucose 4-epimerase [Paenibacillus pini JCM 16418]
MKTVVVTGGAGFIGSHLVKGLIKQQYKVHVIDNLATGYQDRVHAEAELHVQDIRSSETWATICQIKPDTVFHLAAQADVQQSIKEPWLDMDTNVGGTLNMLGACRAASVRKFIFASTSAVYGNLQRDILHEDDPTSPLSFYGLSKLTAERYIDLYEQLFGLSYTILRFANVYGPGQTAKGEGGVIAIFMNQLHQDLPLTINGDGEQTRDFVYVQDVVQALIKAAELKDSDTLHVSTALRTSVNRLVELLQYCHGSHIPVIHRQHQSGDIQHSCLSNTKTKANLSWNPAYTIESGIAATYHYHRNQSI